MISIIDLQADGDLVSAVDFSTQYLVTGHEVMRPSFFGFLSEFVSAGAKPPTNIHRRQSFVKTHFLFCSTECPGN